MRTRGRVKWFNNTKGWGFIETGEHGDVFVHYSAIQAGGFRRLDMGDEVELDVVSSDRGPLAANVCRLGGKSDGFSSGGSTDGGPPESGGK